MYFIVNLANQKIYTKWNYLNDKTDHFSWRTNQEIINAHSYRTDSTRIVRFQTRKKAEEFVQSELSEYPGLVIYTTSYVQYVLGILKDRLKKKDSKHSHCCYPPLLSKNKIPY